ncbi:MAG: hypothetical protein AAGB26_12960 [Planctomycetota bacterium]
MTKYLIAAIAGIVVVVGIVIIWQQLSCGSRVPMAPLYAYDMMDETEVTWELDGDDIGGNAIINHNGDESHEYSVVISIVSDAGQKFISSQSKGQIGHHNKHVRRYGWSDIDSSIRDTIDWPTARIWCEIRIYDEGGTVVFHGIKRSGLYRDAVKQSEGAEGADTE